MKLLELFNQQYKWEESESNSEDHIYTFVDDNNVLYEVSIAEDDPSTIKIQNTQDTISEELGELTAPLYEIVFSMVNQNETLQSKKHNLKIVGGIKNPVKVLSTVVDITQHFVNTTGPAGIVFTAKESSRRSLYARMVKSLSGIIPQYKMYNIKSFGQTGWMFIHEDLINKS